MKNKWNPGDEFKFLPIKTRNRREKCLDPDKTFIVDHIERGHIFYLDTRTNRKCRCKNCGRINVGKYNFATRQIEQVPHLKQAWDFEIVLVRTALERRRDISLKLLNI